SLCDLRRPVELTEFPQNDQEIETDIPARRVLSEQFLQDGCGRRKLSGVPRLGGNCAPLLGFELRGEGEQEESCEGHGDEGR
ncbi:MAG: hypothetical protein ACOCWS_00100, partial [Alkalispirochaetaceae bacterium]